MTALSLKQDFTGVQREQEDSALCQSCGACCAFDETWPRFSLESEAEIALIPDALINARGSGMRCEAGRCSALEGTVGKQASCSIYASRPLVCRDCKPGDDECNTARAKYSFAVLLRDESGNLRSGNK